MRVEAGELERVIILMPPRHGKSLTSTIFFPAWFLGRNPDKYVISASYGQDLAEDFGQKVRNHLQDPLHRMVFPQSVLSGDSQAKDKFTLTEGGMYFAVGRGSAITGRGAHCLVAGTLVETERGPMPIEELAPLVGQIRVVAHQFSTGKDVLCRVRAFRAREARGVVTIRSRGGSVVTGTTDHRLWIHGDYRPMGDACGRDALVRCGGGQDEVESVHREPDREAVVYDIEVEGEHNFFANGILSSNCFLIDDPVKTREEASSETLRRQLHDWFADVAYTRLMPGKSAVVLTQTLWHEDDLAGWIMREQQHDGWHVVRFPAIAEEDEERRKAGDPLWPEKFPLEKLEGIKRTLRTESWLSLYQQRCVSDDGSYFKLAWLRDAFEPKDYTPAEARGFAKYILVDPATSKKRGSDYTAMWVLGLGADRNFYVLDAVRDKLDLRERADKLFELHQRWKPITRVYYEQYALSGDIPYIKEKMNGFGGSPPYRFNITTVGGNVKKTERIGRLVPLMRDHRIRMPRHLWRTCEGREVDLVKLFEEELKAFPVAAHEDMLDSLARITDPEDADHNQLVLEWPKTPDEIQAQSQMAMRDKASRGGGWMAA